MTEARPDDEVKLKREMGFISATNFTITSIIGTGIFVSPTSVYFYSGSVALSVIIWISCGIFTFFHSLLFAELGPLLARSGGEYSIFLMTYGPLHKFWGPLPAFLHCIIIDIISRPVASATVILIASSYIITLIDLFVCFENEEHLQWASIFISMSILMTTTYINYMGIKLYLHIQNVCTVLKVLLCLIVIGGGVYQFSTGNVDYIKSGFEATTLTAKNLALAVYSGMWAYSGSGAIAQVTEEIKRPEINLLRSTVCGIFTVVLFYVLMNVSYMTVLSKSEMVDSSAVAITFGSKLSGSQILPSIFSVGVSMSSIATVMAYQFGYSRIYYVAGQEGHMLKIFSFIHVRRLSPSVGVLLQAFISFLVILIADIQTLIEFMIFLSWVVITGIIIAIFILRKTMKDAHRPFTVPVWILCGMIPISLFMTFTPIITDPGPKYFVALGIILIGFVLYYVFIYRNFRLRCIDRLTHFLQILFEVVPTDEQVSKVCKTNEHTI